MPTLNSISYIVLNEGSGKVQIRDKGSSAQTRFMIAWTDLTSFVDALRGGWKLISPTLISYTRPHKHPDWPFYCTEASVDEVISPTGTGTWEYALITATYAPLSFDPETGNSSDAISEELNFSNDVTVIPAGATYSGSGSSSGDPINRPMKKITPLCDYRVIMNALPQLPGGNAQLILSMMGKLNSTTFRGAAPGKFMFAGARASRSAASITSLNSQNWKVELSAQYRDTGWNKGYDNAGALVDLKDRAGNPIYDSDDLNKLIPGASSP